MYTDKNITYADAGKYLKCDNKVAFQMKASDNIEEFDLNLDDIVVENNYAFYNNHMFAQELNNKFTYGDYKSKIIKKRYSNDDQIAIMLNKEDSPEDEFKYNKMLEWRIFASVLANKLIKL